MTPHFKREELECKCGCGRMEFSLVAVQSLESLRMEFGVPMIIASGFRCPEYNDEVAGTGLEGPHTISELHNITVDVRESGPNAYELLELAIIHGFTGLGIHQQGSSSGRFIHMDRLPQLRPHRESRLQRRGGCRLPRPGLRQIT